MVKCCGTVYLPICGNHKLLLVLNPAVGVSFLIMIKLVNDTESWKAGILSLFIILLLLDLISSKLVL